MSDLPLYTIARLPASEKLGVYKVTRDTMTLGELISEHDTERDAKAAMKRYQQADKRRAR